MGIREGKVLFDTFEKVLMMFLKRPLNKSNKEDRRWSLKTSMDCGLRGKHESRKLCPNLRDYLMDKKQNI